MPLPLCPTRAPHLGLWRVKTKLSYKFIDQQNNKNKTKLHSMLPGHCCCCSHLFVVIIYKQFKQSVCSLGLPLTSHIFFVALQQCKHIVSILILMVIKKYLELHNLFALEIIIITVKPTYKHEVKTNVMPCKQDRRDV